MEEQFIHGLYHKYNMEEQIPGVLIKVEWAVVSYWSAIVRIHFECPMPLHCPNVTLHYTVSILHYVVTLSHYITLYWCVSQCLNIAYSQPYITVQYIVQSVYIVPTFHTILHCPIVMLHISNLTLHYITLSQHFILHNIEAFTLSQ